MESTADFEFSFTSSLESLAQCCSEVLSKRLSHFVKLKTWQTQDKQALLQVLSEFILEEESALLITKFFRPITVEILQRCFHFIQGKDEHLREEYNENFFYIISILLPIVPHIQSYILEYLTFIKPFYARLESNLQDNPKVLTITRTAYNFLRHDYNTFIDVWEWNVFFQLLEHADINVRWLATNIVAMVTQMSDHNKMTMIKNSFNIDKINKLTVEMDADHSRYQSSVHNDENCNKLAVDVTMETITAQCNVTFTEDDFTESHVAISGVILPIAPNCPNEVVVDTLVKVPSTNRNLHSLALAIATGSGVLLEGPVGSGKTCLVEYIAAMTGRISAPSLMKVQLGDQTDSKSLLGTYVCTDTPGEFLWQPGTLLQAVQGGHWVLLEDIDYAPMDVVSVLIPLLESRTLSVPGHGNAVKAAPGFQLFATQRTHSHSGSALHVHSNSAILDRLWTRVNVEPLNKEELCQVISKKFSDLASVSHKLIDVYSLVSSDTQLVSDSDISLSSLSHDKRQSTTRDLMKWTSRVAESPVNGPFFAEAKDVFLEAQDCFGATLSKAEHRLELGMAIGAKLGITKEKVEFFCKNYKPKVQLSYHSVTVGRVLLPRHFETGHSTRETAINFAHTRHSLVLLERVAVCIKQEEPVLLVGETGSGKTSSVQNLAAMCGHNLKVINMSQQSDSSDLLGGFKPVEMKQLVGPVRETFEELFCQTFSRKQNVKYLSHIQQCFAKGQWEMLFKLMMHSYKAAMHRIEKADNEISSQGLCTKWEAISHKIEHLKKQQKHAESTLTFQFVEGTLVKAIRDGDWILLDEINLATPETLECLGGLLESRCGSVVLLERGDVKPIVRHQGFRLFACMNPATDVGKKDLPLGIRNRFTEIFVDELNDVNDLKTLVVDYLQGLSPAAAIVDGIVRFYLTARLEANDKLTDGTGHKPHYSLRTLCRALRYASSNPHGNVLRSIYEGFCLSFLTQLDRSSHPVVESLIRKNILGHVNATSLINQPLPCPGNNNKQFVNFEGFWINVGEKETVIPAHYVLTASVKANLRDLARVVSGRTFPVLLQGETSVGKTSLIQWLASASGNHCVRINNHEHTDIQEYLGCYTSDHDGRLVFKEGVLVDAMRKGYWIILDELNLAPTDVLEALNRLLDDNRELFIAETQETVKAHPNFMLFATQNPPGQYGGRKVLSRAFRNRFVELHFDELPSKELEQILHLRGNIPMSYAKKMVSVLLDLQSRRRSSSVFAGKQGFITLRDLFRWAERYSKTPDVPGRFYNWEQHLAEDGYMLLAGRCRNPAECSVIQEVLQIHFKSNIDPVNMFTSTPTQSNLPLSSSKILNQATSHQVDGFGHVVWTRNMKRLAVLVGRALEFGEPVLLVGETGCGKTTICQLFAALKEQQLYSVNCHMHSESSDFLGGLRPVRSHHLEDQEGKLQKFFEWCDGPLVLAMKEGAMFLIDEISLADDSVLERLNSVLEPERTLVLAEKGSEGGGVNDKDVDIIVADDKFRVVATMNPGGDFGKKELSPALRNRFTEIWCPSTNTDQDLVEIIEYNLTSGISFNTTPEGHSGIGKAMVEFVNWFRSTDFGRRFVVSIRDLLSWVHFINTCCQSTGHMTSHEPSHQPSLHPTIGYLHGVCLVFLDALGAGLSSLPSAGIPPQEAREICLDFLRSQVKYLGVDDAINLDTKDLSSDVTQDVFGIKPFYIPKGPLTIPHDLKGTYALNAPTTSQNAQRLLRALQLSRPILLEGSPGVGKTSLVNAIAKASGHELVRINLSEQTDITDLFGADLPVEGGDPGMFTWRDGPLLRALKAGHWIVFDELNLASQSVLEGLNACLDHRAEVYIPELGMSFKVQHTKTRLFACQNPLNQGGGRKGLPKSFLNRFTQVYVEPLSKEDLLFITTSLFPNMEPETLQKMIVFNMQLHHETVVQASWGKKGSPWEFNLRDVFRWCELFLGHKSSSMQELFHYAKLIYSDRMRTSEDKKRVMELLYKTFNHHQDLDHVTLMTDKPWLHVTTNHLQVGYSFLPRRECSNSLKSSERSLQILRHHLPYMESLMKCIEMGWMAVLVGKRSCGKTSLVQMLAELTGNKLDVLAINSSMDTTELLGGFEQANLNLHWQKIVKDSEDLVQRTVRCALLKKTRIDSSSTNGPKEAFELYAKWERFVKSSSAGPNGQNNTKKATDLSVSKIEDLFDILENLSELSSHCSADTDSLKASAHNLKKRLHDNHGNTHCGGQFEWIDGQLVEALKTGNWLLIDNVNFCSPSVLDRLNALLEPGGVLSINERGVVNGEVPSIKPHPDFRLILAMDPSYGEISRAMRNRGVEIYMPGEDDESTSYDNYDLQVMLNGLGLNDRRICQMLLVFHKDYKTKLGGSILDLVHAAKMITNLQHRGESLGTALVTSLSQVYVRSHVNKTDRQIAEDVVELHVKQSSFNLQDKASISPTPPSVWEFSENSMLANIRWLCTPLSQLLWENQSLDILKHAVDIVMERATFDDWKLRCDVVSSLLCKSAMAMEPSKLAVLNDLVNMVKSVHERLFGSSLMNGLKKTFTQLTLSNSGLDIMDNQPFDIRLTRHLSHQIDWKECGPEMEIRLSNLCNRINLFGRRLKHAVSNGTKTEKTLLSMSQRFHEGLASMEMLPHPIIAHLFPFFKVFNEFLDWLILLDLPLNDDKLVEALESLEWISRLYSICTSATAFSLELLSLHWQWFFEQTFKVVPTIMCCSQNEFPSDLMTIVNQLSQGLGTDTHLAKVHLRMIDNFGHPLAFKSESVYQNWGKLRQLCHLLEVSWRQDMTSYEQSQLSNQLNLLVKDGVRAREILCKGIAGVFGNEIVMDSELESVVDDVTAVISPYGLLPNQPYTTPLSEDAMDESVCVSVSHDTVTKVMMLPLCNVMAHFQERCIVAELLEEMVKFKCTSSLVNCNVQELDAKMNALVNYLVTNSTTSPLSLAVYHYLQAVILQDIERFPSLIKNMDSELTYSILTNELHSNTSLNVAMWAMTESCQSQLPSTQEAAELGKGSLDCFLFKILNNQPTKQKRSVSPDDSLSSVAIGNHREKTEQLAVLLRHIWSNADHVTNLANQNRLCELSLCASKFAQVILALSVLMETDSVHDDIIKVAMAITTSHDLSGLKELLEKISSKVFDSYKKQTGSTNNTTEMETLLLQAFSYFSSCCHKMHRQKDKNRQSSDERDDISVDIACIWVNLGLLQTLLLCPIGPVDPVEKSSIELQYVRDEITDAKQELHVRLYAEQLWTGYTTTLSELEKQLDEGLDPSTLDITSNPLRVKILAQKLKKAKDKEKDLQRHIAVRPSPSQFGEILRSIKHYELTIGSPDTVVQLMTGIQRAVSSLRLQYDEVQHVLNSAHSIIQRVTTWILSQEKFMLQIKNDFPLYGDVTGPFVAAVAQIVHGMNTLSSCLQLQLQRHMFLLKCPDALSVTEVICPDSLISALCNQECFLDKGNLDMVKYLMSGPTWSCIQGMSLQTKEETSYQRLELTSRLLWISILHIQNYTLHHNYLNNKAMNQFVEILNIYTQQWTLAKDEEQKREQQQESLYKFKTTTHEGEIDEEKAFEKGLCKAFPTFDNDFSEFIQSNNLEEAPKHLDKTDTSGIENSEAEEFMKCVDIQKISRLHESLFTEIPYSQSCMLIGGIVKPCYHGDSFEELIQSSYQAAAIVSMMNEQARCSSVVGGYHWEPHLLQSQHMLQQLVKDHNVQTTDKHYDIYHDSNIPEVIKIQPVMTSFRVRLDELLAEWPDNPLLSQLQLFIDKILALPVTSPVMKVLTGIELLLKNAQDWENNASRHVTIKSNLDQITNLVIEWRKLELKCWSSLLDVATDNVSSKASKWWFYLYSLIQQALTAQTELSDFIDPLQRFIESSSLGEFASRMKMLYSFYQQSVAMETTNETNKAKISDVMLNIYTYYKQFSATVEQRIYQARDPIEKELKGYVKIAKWNDSNFWAMKQATEKSHRTLHKFVRRYEMALSEPVRQLLMDPKKIIGSIQQGNVEESRDIQLNPDWFISESEPANGGKVLETRLHHVTGHVERLPKLFSRMKKLCYKILKEERYSTLSATLNEFTGEIITGVHDLQSLDVVNQPKEKQKEMRKHIHLRKRTALAELFKTLSSIGLSHKKGLQNASLSSLEFSMLLPGFEETHIDSLLHSKTRIDLNKAAGFHANKCQHYYHRCLARMSALNVHLTSPSKELTVGDIDRCKGYSHHLMTVIQNQRKAIVEMTKRIRTLRLASRSLSSVVVEKGPVLIPPQDDLPHQMTQFLEFLTWVSQLLKRSLHLVKCCPQQPFTNDCTPVPSNMLSAVSKASSSSEVIQNIETTLKNCQASVANVINELRPYVVTMENQTSGSDVGNSVIASWEHVKALSCGVQSLTTIGRNIRSLLCHFESRIYKDMGLGGCLYILTQRIESECQRLETWNQTLVQTSTSHGTTLPVEDFVDKAVTTLLLGVQRLSKVLESRDGNIDNEEVEEDNLLEGHLVSHIYQAMVDDIAKLDLFTVQDSVISFISELKASATTHQTANNESPVKETPYIPLDVTRHVISTLVSLLDQYLCLADGFLLSLLTAHNTTSKLLSVLLGVFTELVEKGFCLPPEVEEEDSGEGATDFEDIQDGGLGEGEGAKDVSDQIENEDQLQDAKKDGENEENQQNNEHIPEEENGIEMSEDFDGAMHDVEGEEQDQEHTDDEQEEEDLDKQMGELDGKEDEKLDEKIWGDSDDEEEKENNEGESEKGAGADAETESEMVAKEDNKDAVDESKEKEQEPKDDKEETINDLPKEDSGNLSDGELDPQGEEKDKNVPENEAGDLNLPDDLELDDGNENQGDEELGDETEGKEDGTEEEEEEKETEPEANSEQSMDIDQEETAKEDEDVQENEETKGEVEHEENEDHQEGEQAKDGDDQDWRTQQQTEAEDVVQATDDNMANDGGSNQNEVMEQTAGQSEPNDNQDQQGVGSAKALGNEGHSGEAEVASAQTSTDAKQKQRKQMNRSRSDRSLGSMDERTHKRLKTVDETDSIPPPESDVKKTAELYQHLKGNDSSNHDAQTLDSATADQSREQDGSRVPEHMSDYEDEDENMECDDRVVREKEDNLKQLQQQKTNPQGADSDMKSREEIPDREDMETSFESRDKEIDPDRSESSYHVSSEAFLQEKQELSIDQDKLRSDLEHQLAVWSNLDHGTLDQQRHAQSTWHKYELLTSGLAQELCEQLRLVLEPSLATKLRGDYRTGKRLNMRKVIPYIASQFRKDKIWLRRTKPSKREYQVMIAVDDSSSMADNHSKQLAFESLAVISKALTRLEAGDLGVCSFGETVKLLHPLHEPFTDQSGAKILQQFTFDQKKTKIAELVSTCSSLMLSSKSRLPSGPRSRAVTSQLLLVVSDGRGVFLEGTETVRKTVRAAKEAGIFLVFVIIDNPINRDSILDIKVPIFHPGKPPEIKSYIEQFPFPFYVILRDINSLPVTLSDALRQWFELVTSMDS